MPSGRKQPIEVDGVTYPSLAAAARALGISKQAIWLRVNPKHNDRKTVRRPQHNHSGHVLSTGAPGDSGRRLTTEERSALLADLWVLSARAVARKHGLSTSTVNYYRKRFRSSR